MEKKSTVVTTRVSLEVGKIINDLAEKDDRKPAYITRKLIEEALINRKLLKPEKTK